MQKFISSSVFTDFKEAVSLAKELNTGIEISRISHDISNIDETFNSCLAVMKKALTGFENEISLHAFFFDLCVISPDPTIRDASVYRYKQILDAAKILNAKTVVFHTSFIAKLKHVVYHDNFKRDLIVFWKSFVKLFEEAGIVAVLENLLEEDPSFIFDVVKGVDSDYLKISLDIGHVNIHSPVPVVDWLKQYGDSLYHMHIHNNYGDDDSHLSVLKGTINIHEVFEAIKSLNIRPKMVFEIFNKNDVIESINCFDSFFNKKIKEKI